MSLTNLKSSFRPLFTWFKTRPGRRSTDDWVMFLMIMAFLFIVVAVYEGWLFFAIERDAGNVIVTTGKEVDTIDRDALGKAIEYLDKRSGN